MSARYVFAMYKPSRVYPPGAVFLGPGEEYTTLPPGNTPNR
jgi:hypothetical protein